MYSDVEREILGKLSDVKVEVARVNQFMVDHDKADETRHAELVRRIGNVEAAPARRGEWFKTLLTCIVTIGAVVISHWLK